MARLRRIIPFALLLALVPALALAQVPVTCDGINQVPPAAPGAQPDHFVFVNQQAAISFNGQLDPALETSFGDETSRKAAFLQAVNDWNVALANVGAQLLIVPTLDDNAWATEQGSQYCQEPDAPNTDVYSDFRGAHFNDGGNQVSTGLNPGGVNLDPAMAPLGAGWVLPGTYVATDTSSSVVTIDAALAAPKLKFDPANTTQVLEADIAWYTHTHYEPLDTNPACPRTSWDYRYPAGPDAGRYDFYSIMLHSVGHLLGIGHQGPDVLGTNVMQAAIGKGERRSIGPKELMCLCIRYGPGAPTCAIATAAKRSTWGQLKSVYR